MTRASCSAFLFAVALTAACTVHGTDVPELTGPSEFAQSITVTATPDAIQQDGFSQSLVAVVARGPDGQALAGVSIRLQTATDGAIQDFGRLSARTVVTGSDGRATATYTAPAPPADFGSNGSRVSILATPIGNNYDTAQTQSADIRLTAPGVVLPPSTAPTPSFIISPTPVTAGTTVFFDASASCATQDACGSTAGISSFVWNFGDGRTGSGRTATHQYGGDGTYTVTLTVTNDRGLSASSSQTVSVSLSSPPSASFVSSPSSPRAGSVINFDASQSTASPGRRIVQYNWNFGDGTQGQTGNNTTHTYAAAGTYTIVLVVVDDLGLRATTTGSLTVLP